jgi:hypothetical protein
MKARIIKSEMTGRYVLVFTADHEFAGGKAIPKSSDMAKVRIDIHDIVMAEAKKVAREQKGRVK